MAQWQELLRLDSALQSRVSQLYERRFPREIRHWLSVVIESQDWHWAAVDENKARVCFQTLLVYLEEQWNRSVQEKSILQGPDFSGMRDYLLKHFQDRPLDLAITLSECLTEEKKFLDSASEEQACSSPTPEQNWRQLDNKVNDLKTHYLGIKKENKSLERLYEKLDSIQETWQFQVEQHAKLAQSLADVKAECQKQANFLIRTAQVLVQQIVNTLKVAEEIVVTLTEEELPQWKRRQQMACIGSRADTSLDHLQKWFTAVTEVLLDVREQLQKLRDQSKKYDCTDASDLAGPMAETENFAVYLCTKLLSNALVVEKQPVMTGWPQRPLILKTTVQFAVSVRFLANLPKFKWHLNVKPAFDKDVEEERTIKGFRRFALSRDNAKVLDEDAPGEGLVAEFGNMLLKEREKKKERDKGLAEKHLLVAEELHIIKFVTGFQYAGLKFDIEASTLPVVVVSSTNQFVWAWASIMWFNMVSTSEPWNLSLFVEPPPLTWTQLSQVLGWQFFSIGQRELDENQLLVLKEKIVDDPDDLIHWRTFSKSDSAWVWIDGILDLIKRHLQDLWREGFIMGFVSRKRTRALLQEKQTGNFLLRFSESNKDGAITFSFVDHSSGEALVHAVEPYTKQELEVMCLADVIQLYSFQFQGNSSRNPLVYLYPDIPKDSAFGPYYKISAKMASELDQDGYKRKNFIPVTVYPTPPPSPPRQVQSAERDIDMDMDMDKNTVMDIQALFQELFSDLYDVNGQSDLWTCEVEEVETHNNLFDSSMSS